MHFKHVYALGYTRKIVPFKGRTFIFETFVHTNQSKEFLLNFFGNAFE
jgi:hypothetical protein